MKCKFCNNQCLNEKNNVCSKCSSSGIEHSIKQEKKPTYAYLCKNCGYLISSYYPFCACHHYVKILIEKRDKGWKKFIDDCFFKNPIK